MHIYQRGTRGTWWVDFATPNGQRVRCSTRTTDERQAREFADRLKAQSWRTAQLGERPRRSWQDAVLRFIRETRTKRTHDEDLAKFRWLHAYLGHLLLDQINPDVIDKVRGALVAGNGPRSGSTEGTVNKYLALMRSVLRKAEREWQWLDKAPVFKLSTNRHTDSGHRWLKREQADSLIQALALAGLDHTVAMVRFTLATGLRETNVTGLTWDRVDLGKRIAWIDSGQSKSGRAISVPLNATAVAVLRACRFKHADRVFTYQGKPIRRANTRAWKAVLRSEGLRVKVGRHRDNFSWHDLRHTWASWHVMEGTPLEVLQRLGGWQSIDMVLRYAHLAPGHIAAFADRVDGTTTVQAESGHSRMPVERA